MQVVTAILMALTTRQRKAAFLSATWNMVIATAGITLSVGSVTAVAKAIGICSHAAGVNRAVVTPSDQRAPTAMSSLESALVGQVLRATNARSAKLTIMDSPPKDANVSGCSTLWNYFENHYVRSIDFTHSVYS